jgi:hypothetical protein
MFPWHYYIVTSVSRIGRDAIVQFLAEKDVIFSSRTLGGARRPTQTPSSGRLPFRDKPTTHLHQVPELMMCRAISASTLHVSMAWCLMKHGHSFAFAFPVLYCDCCHVLWRLRLPRAMIKMCRTEQSRKWSLQTHCAYFIMCRSCMKYYEDDNFACGSVWVWNLVSDIKGGT